MTTALAQLSTHPVPVVAWKIHAALGRVRAQTGDDPGARDAFAAAAVVDQIAASVSDEALRATSLSSEAVRGLRR